MNGKKIAACLLGSWMLAGCVSAFSVQVQGTAIMNHTEKGGTLAVTFPDSRGECKGTYGLCVNGAGNWFLECRNGLTASGALNANSWEKPSKATGIDNRSRLVVYQILPINL